MLIDTPLLVVGHGPAALVVAKVAGACGLACVLVGHDGASGDDDEPIAIDAPALAALEGHGLVDVLRPYLTGTDPPAITTRAFEEVIKHHCVADLNVTVYDQMTVVDRQPVGPGVTGVLTDGRSRWDVRADVFVDADQLPATLPAAITAGEAAATDAVQMAASPPAPG
jgi:hypothetical protein